MLKKFLNLDYHHQLLVNVAKGALVASVASNLAGGAIVSYLLFSVVPLSYIIFWIVGNTFAFIFRIYTSKKFIKQDDTKYDKYFLKLIALSVSINSLLYSFMILVATIYNASDIVIIMLVFPIIALVSGSISTLGSVYIIFFLFNTISIFSLVAVLLYHGGDMFVVLSFMIIVFYFVYIVAGYKFFLTTRNSLSLDDTFKMLYDESPNGIMLIQKNRFIDCNDSILRMFKYDKKEIFLNSHISYLSPAYQPGGELSTKKMLKMTMKTTTNNINSFEWVHTNLDGNDFWCSVILTKIYLEGEEFIYGVWQDISTKKNLEIQQQVLLQEIEDSNDSLVEKVKQEVEKNRKKDKQLLEQSRFAQMGEMISMIAHQWRQPLAAISSRCMGMELKAQLGKMDKDVVVENTRYIAQYSQHLSSTIDDFRNFFKTDKAKVDFTYEEIVKSVLNIMEASVVSKEIEVVTKLNSTVVFNSFQNELKQVVINIIKNAEDALLDNKTKDAKIIIHTDATELTISDNAGGIDKSVIGKIFDPYFSTKLEKNGTGLGLYMSKIIIEEHCSGSLNVENNEEGAVFKIKLNI